ncbi:juvenile hormone esterase isoform X2 [Amyelois transitella]|uniref:juvenile hormone esterase isoform X2 n=1 Tax=Amyelois transitella TaxID=680683 RepID=UPI0029903463|nr:juvenile hormone esterase isoform X2 [Amyelois transitella]
MMGSYLARSSRSLHKVATMNDPIVTVQQGKLKGSILSLVDGSTCYSFKGVPYAQPPTGPLRFKAPEPPLQWQGIYEATKHGPSCPQVPTPMLSNEEKDENCLFLNIYTKSLQPKSKLPVMVFIHGGAFLSGSGDSSMYGPDFLLQHDVILVTINSRLEVFGFLCLNTRDVPGNAGLKDQVSALKWVKRNIEQFGGDPDNVTLFGESAGAASVAYHMISPMSKGLFHKVIAQSGTCIDDWSIQRDSIARAIRCGKFLGKETEDVNELLQYFRGLPSNDFIGLTLKTRLEDEKYRGLSILFAPVVEQKFDGVESFLNEEPLDILLSGNYNKVPLIIGYNSGEGLFTLSLQLKKAEFYNKHVKYLVPREIASKMEEDQMIEFGDRIKNFYVGDKNFGEHTAEAIVKFQTDVYFTYNIHRFVHFYRLSNQPVFAYRFNYETDLNIIKKLSGISLKGACHADDLFYFFHNEGNKDVYREKDKIKEIVFNLTKMWTNFAKFSNPTPDKSLGVTWPPTSSGREFMNLEEPLSFGQCPELERVKFWNKLYCDGGVPHIPTSRV